MTVRTKSGVREIGGGVELLEFLGVKENEQLRIKHEECGKHIAVTSDVELIAPFALAADGEAGQGFPWTLSTFDLDRIGERIDPAGWDYKRYMDNPVVEWAHCYDIPAIGKADALYADESGLHGVVVFNDKDYDPFGWGIGQRVKAGVIRAGSVGFRILEIEIPSKEESRDGTALIFRKQELLEFSICNVPANPWALAKPPALRKGADVNKTAGIPDFWGGLLKRGVRSEE
jgi:HK97 family phage prohead protease